MAGGTVLFRAATTAYKQAIISEFRHAVRSDLTFMHHHCRCLSAMGWTDAAAPGPPAADGTRAGVGAEGAQAAARAGGKQLSLQEAQQILGVESGATWDQIAKKYDHLFSVNEKHGSFYLQSKVFRAKERLEQEFVEKGMPMPGHGGEGQQQPEQPSGEQQQQQAGRRRSAGQ